MRTAQGAQWLSIPTDTNGRHQKAIQETRIAGPLRGRAVEGA
ncbi:hypothetical protein [Azospirillum formosense]